jgi:hypothetical protein
MTPARRALVALLVIVPSLLAAPMSAAAAPDPNQVALDAARAEQVWLSSISNRQFKVVHGQREMSNAEVLAILRAGDANHRLGIPNTSEMYGVVVQQVVAYSDANMANARAQLAARPGDPHLMSELANATEISRALNASIGNTYDFIAKRVIRGGGGGSTQTPQRAEDVEEMLYAEGTEDELLYAGGADEDLTYMAEAEDEMVYAILEEWLEEAE